MPRQSDPGNKMMSVKDLSDYLGGVPINTIYKWNKDGTGPKRHKLGRCIYYRWADVEEWIKANERVSFR
jgi:predicted DNA-binding transcriptional regulator AlpA